MSTLAGTELAFHDVAKSLTQDGRLIATAELLDQVHGIASDAPWVPGNTIAGHLSAQRSSLPTVYTKTAGTAVASSKSTKAQLAESAEMLEGWSIVEDVVSSIGGNKAAILADEEMTFIESMAQTTDDRIIYGNGSTTVGQLNGWAQRYASTTATNGSNVIKMDSGASGADQMSIYVCYWAQNKNYLWYPQGTTAGLEIKHLGEVSQLESNGGQRLVNKTRFRRQLGIGLDDWRALVRLANIDKSNLIAGTGADLPEGFIKASKIIQRLSGGRAVGYMNLTTEAWFDLQCRNDVTLGGGLNYENLDGQQVMSFRGIRLSINDRLTEAESAVS